MVFTARFSILALLIGLPLACRNAGPARRESIVKDSLGVRIVVNFDDPVANWRLTPSPLLDIGSATDTLTSLYEVEGAHRLSDGRIVIANRGTNELRFYSATGSFLKAVGRKGRGPGEYQYIAWMARCGTDTLYVYDIGTARLTVLNDRGETVRLAQLMLPENTLPYGAATCQRGGPFVVAGWATGTPQPGLHRFPMPVGLATLNGEPLNMIGLFPGVDRWGTVFGGQLRGTSPLPLGRNLLQTIAGDRVYVGTGDAYEVAAYGLDGTLEMLIRLEVPERPVTDADIEAYIERQLGGLDDSERRERLRRSYLKIEFPKHLPPYAAFVVDDAGTLWIQDFPGPRDEEVVWRRFSPDGHYIGRAIMKAGLKVFEIGGGYLLGVRRDELDVEHVQLFGFEASKAN